MADQVDADAIAAIRAELAAEAGVVLPPTAPDNHPGVTPTTALAIIPATEAAETEPEVDLQPLTINEDGSVVTTEHRFDNSLAADMRAMLDEEAESVAPGNEDGPDGQPATAAISMCDVVFVVGPNDLSTVPPTTPSPTPSTTGHPLSPLSETDAGAQQPRVRFPAIRGVLGCRSAAFRELLFSGPHKHAIVSPQLSAARGMWAGMPPAEAARCRVVTGGPGRGLSVAGGIQGAAALLPRRPARARPDVRSRAACAREAV